MTNQRGKQWADFRTQRFIIQLKNDQKILNTMQASIVDSKKALFPWVVATVHDQSLDAPSLDQVSAKSFSLSKWNSTATSIVLFRLWMNGWIQFFFASSSVRNFSLYTKVQSRLFSPRWCTSFDLYLDLEYQHCLWSQLKNAKIFFKKLFAISPCILFLVCS